MGYGATLSTTTSSKHEERNFFLTAVIPSYKCNLKCPHCIIKAKSELLTDYLNYPSVHDYTALIQLFSNRYSIKGFSIQGYEPLLDESWLYTKGIAKICQDLQIPFSLVTNGVNFKKYSRHLANYPIDRTAISIDSDHADLHDAKRGVKCFQTIIHNIQYAQKYPDLFKSIRINSVLSKNRVDDILGMPKLLNRLNIKEWVVIPELKTGKKSFGTLDQDIYTLKQDLLLLFAQCQKHGISLFVENDSFQLDKLIDHTLFSFVRYVSPNLIRLSPNGYFSIGKCIPSNKFNGRWFNKGRLLECSIHEMANSTRVLAYAS